MPRSRIEELVAGLLGEATKLAPGHAIEISMSRSDGSARLVLRATGAVRGGPPPTLGVATVSCRRIASLLGGELRVSPGADGGTSFLLELPLATTSHLTSDGHELGGREPSPFPA